MVSFIAFAMKCLAGPADAPGDHNQGAEGAAVYTWSAVRRQKVAKDLEGTKVLFKRL